MGETEKKKDNEIKNEDTYYVYIMECSDSTFYTGITNDLEKRIKMHNQGKASKYTRSRLPVKMVYKEQIMGKGKALSRELAIKKLNRVDKLKLIQKEGVKL